ncbi:MAG: class I SAM-dependent methyltransferase [Candidatus Kerfeldbacteria bacterium]
MSDTMYKQGEYLEKNPTWHEEDSPWKAGKILAMLKKNNIQPKTVCEVGCGAGEILNQMLQQMPDTVEFTGYEISPQAYEIAKKKEQDRLHFKLQDIAEDKDASFDVVMAIDVFEHIEDYMEFLRMLKNKGTYQVFHIPLDISTQAQVRRTPLKKVRKDVGHIHLFTKQTALAALRAAGYEVLDTSYTAGTIDLPSKSLLSAMARLPRKLLFSLNKNLAVRLLGGHSLLVLTK